MEHEISFQDGRRQHGASDMFSGRQEAAWSIKFVFRT